MLTALLTPAVALILRVVWPKAPAWVAALITKALPQVVRFVEEAAEAAHLTGDEKHEFVLHQVRIVLDEGLDDIPEWSELTEDERDELLDALIKWVVFIRRLQDHRAKPVTASKDLRKAFRGMRKLGQAPEGLVR